MDLQRDSAVQVGESFCSRASPTCSREGEREGSRVARVEEEVCGEGAPQPSLYRGLAGCPLAPPPSLGPAATWEEWGASFPPF